tara:strand:+ start:185 stop:640 length:456 start_codon:yes stop_codon:yes gene_type:complete
MIGYNNNYEKYYKEFGKILGDLRDCEIIRPSKSSDNPVEDFNKALEPAFLMAAIPNNFSINQQIDQQEESYELNKATLYSYQYADRIITKTLPVIFANVVDIILSDPRIDKVPGRNPNLYKRFYDFPKTLEKRVKKLSVNEKLEPKHLEFV